MLGLMRINDVDIDYVLFSWTSDVEKEAVFLIVGHKKGILSGSSLRGDNCL